MSLYLTLCVFAYRAPPLSAPDESRKSCTVGMASVVLTLLSSAWLPLDLSAHQDALILAGNLLAGMGTEFWQKPQAFSFWFLFDGWGGWRWEEKY